MATTANAAADTHDLEGNHISLEDASPDDLVKLLQQHNMRKAAAHIAKDDEYTVRELNVDTGEYDLVYEIDYFDGHINAVAMLDGGDYGYYALGAFGGYLCRFDDEGKICDETA